MRFPVLRQKLTQILPSNLLKGATIHVMFIMVNHLFQISVQINDSLDISCGSGKKNCLILRHIQFY